MRRRIRSVHDPATHHTMKYILCLLALLGLASAGYISHGWSSPVVVRRVYVPVRYSSGWSGYGGRSGGYGGWSGGYGGRSLGYGGWSGGYGGSSGGYGGWSGGYGGSSGGYGGWW